MAERETATEALARRRKRMFNMEVSDTWHFRFRAFAQGQHRSMGAIARDAVELYQQLAPTGEEPAIRGIETEDEGDGWRRSLVTRANGTRFRVTVQHGDGRQDEARRVWIEELDPPGPHRWAVE